MDYIVGLIGGATITSAGYVFGAGIKGEKTIFEAPGATILDVFEMVALYVATMFGNPETRKSYIEYGKKVGMQDLGLILGAGGITEYYLLTTGKPWYLQVGGCAAVGFILGYWRFGAFALPETK